MEVPTRLQVNFWNRIRTSYSALDYVYSGRKQGDAFAVNIRRVMEFPKVFTRTCRIQFRVYSREQKLLRVWKCSRNYFFKEYIHVLIVLALV